MGDGNGQFDVAHAGTADRGTGDFNAALFTNHAAVADSFIFSAVTFPVLGGSENSFTEKTVAFRFLGAVIDGFGSFTIACSSLRTMEDQCVPRYCR